MTNGEKLRIWRERAGLSQADAAEKIGTKQRTWAQWESEGTTPEIDFAEALEKLTGGAVTMRDWVRSRRKKRRDEAAESSTSLAADADAHGKAS